MHQCQKPTLIISTPQSNHFRYPLGRACMCRVAMQTVTFNTLTQHPQQYSTIENPSLSRKSFLANLMHGHSDSS